MAEVEREGKDMAVVAHGRCGFAFKNGAAPVMPSPDSSPPAFWRNPEILGLQTSGSAQTGTGRTSPNAAISEVEEFIINEGKVLGLTLSASAARQIVDRLEVGEVEDPVVVFWWNLPRLAALDASLGTLQVQQQLQGAGVGAAASTKDAVLQWLDAHGAERIGEPTQVEDVLFFRDPAVLEQCRRSLMQELDYAHVPHPALAARLNMPVLEPIARTMYVYKTERVKPAVAVGDFFYA